jgi:hypothetical protein
MIRYIQILDRESPLPVLLQLGLLAEEGRPEAPPMWRHQHRVTPTTDMVGATSATSCQIDERGKVFCNMAGRCNYQ